MGNSGSGKTTIGRALAAALGAPFVELDSIYHQKNWEPLPADEFLDRVRVATAGDTWVVDGNYSAVRSLVWERADAVVWFDLRRATVMRQLLGRTLRRAAGRVELWNGNRERWRNVFSRDPKESVIAWGWHNHDRYHEQFTAAAGDPRWSHLSFHRIRSRRDVRHLLQGAAN